MAVWLYAYGKNNILGADIHSTLEWLNKVDIDEVKILDSVFQVKSLDESIELYYTQNRKKLEEYYFSLTDEAFIDYLKTIKAPALEKNEIVDYFIREGLEKERRESEHFYDVYNQLKNNHIQSKWEIGKGGSFYNNLCYYSENNGLRIFCKNDLVEITGPSEVFSVYRAFQKTLSPNFRKYYHQLFMDIMAVFKSPFILYAHEWSGLDDEDESFNYEKLQLQADWGNTSSKSIHSMERFYYEEIKICSD